MRITVRTPHLDLLFLVAAVLRLTRQLAEGVAQRD